MIDPPSIPTDAEYVPPSYYRYTRQLGRQNTPAMGVGVNQLGGPNGTSLEVRKQLFGGTANHALALSPFQIYQAGITDQTNAAWWRTFEVHTGLVSPPYQSSAKKPSNDDTAASPLLISPGPSVTNYNVYLKLTLAGWGTLVIAGETAPFGVEGTIGVPLVQCDGTYWYINVGNITTGANTTALGGIYPAGNVSITQFLSTNLSLAAPVFPVAVTSTSGSAGSSTAYCSFEYGVKDLTGLPMFTGGVAPVFTPARIVKCACVAGTHGLAFYDTSGVFNLIYVDETEQQTNC